MSEPLARETRTGTEAVDSTRTGHSQGESALLEQYLASGEETAHGERASGSGDTDERSADEGDEFSRIRRERDFWRSLYTQLVGCFPEGAFAVAAGGEITNWNGAMTDLNGTGADRVLGENAYDIFETEGESETLAEKVIRRNEPIQENDTRTVPHSDRYHQVYAVPLRDPDGNAIGAFEATPDVTEFVHQRQEFEELQETVSQQVQSEVVELEANTEAITDTIDRIHELGVEQTQRMETIASEVSDQSATIEEIVSTTETVQRTSDEAADLADEGADAASGAIETMESVSDAAEDVSADIETLHESIDEIGEIVDVIDGIADQTNILALNAQIEAAQAGEEGAGFAIVASEVKSLAEETQEQAGRIEATIEDVQAEIESTADQFETTTDRIDDGVDRVENALARLDDIATAIDDAAAGVGEVATAIDDQAAGSEEIAATVDLAVDEMNGLRDELETISESTREQRESVVAVRSTVRQLSASAESTAENATE
ncbi:methyl-accepting chemotaxis protein [Natrialba asiatica]|uniref:Transducer protein car n=1 Tax=Natrialba asiatica (strain ATCC 700177 / DSM 12278 / JCM 9576 / FERM P-10747 / NBRC 102637 / 172P1) TaxID=29540 RepID=M0AQ00_NATA1|nr:methyl-accepting chemotaxis protein [Natrialba asiatica]ELZ00806.1 transducer protein car [Natrialba asiatica DSM 12278]